VPQGRAGDPAAVDEGRPRPIKPTQGAERQPVIGGIHVKFSLTTCELLYLLGERPRCIVGSVASTIKAGIAIMNELSGFAIRLQRILRDIRFAFAALAAGSRVVSMADNREVIADLAASAASIYGRIPHQVNG
jgi:hypothetical protein